MDLRKLLLASSLFFLFAACAKSEEEPTPDYRTAVTVQAPVLTDGTKLQWKKGDIIMICKQQADATLYKMEAQSDGEKVVFKGNIPNSMTTFKAFYPGNLTIKSSSETNLHFKWESQQKGQKDGIVSGTLPMAAIGEDVMSGFTFKCLASALKFTLAGSDIASVSITVGSSDTDYLASDVMIANCSTLNTSVSDKESLSRTLTMTPSSGDTFEPGSYCFGLISKSSVRSITGYTIAYTKADGTVTKREFSDLLTVVSNGMVEIPGDETTVVYKSSKVSGKVTNASTGAALSGIPVSDGMQIVKTDANGSYSFTSNLTKSQTVFVIMPSEYEFSFNDYGGWYNYQLIDTDKKEQTVDFALTKRSEATDKYRLLLLGDPQQMSSRQHSIESWTYVCNAINSYRSSVSVPMYEISLGDMVTNEIEVPGMAEAYLATQRTSGVGTFSVPGNHDHVQAATSYYASVSEFSRWFGPYNYAFNLGKQHFIFLDSCAWCEGTDGDKYAVSLNEQGITFLEKDLALVPAGTPVHIFTHCPLTKKQNASIPTTNKYHNRMIAALKGRNVNFWYGHIHYGSNYSYTAAELSSYASGVKSLDSHLVSRCGGCWGCSGDICKDGTPRGFVELDIDGTSSTWHFHSINEYPHNFNTYYPGQFSGEGLASYDASALYCNVYMWDNLWSVPEVWIGGSKEADMQKVKQSTDAAYDPLYQHLHKKWDEEGRYSISDPPATTNNMHLFKYVPSKGVESVEIRIKDRWGNTEKRTIHW